MERLHRADDTVGHHPRRLPGIIQHTLSLGLSMKLNDNTTLSAAWVHGFRNSIQGNIIQETGAFSRA